ncbi:hypothetical protein SARC_05165 [Sphaeroforma arctica JP610]|uniref:Transmembrane protein n=1 Tax=Sphaeroforma arctica JP610 TaxID=667725 RepID=A0A0L0G0B3_9EUKA|nr:hypothetical protein SARC_05165 [Sphaeroforma arctica JP610]KNC82552.1 hypothetical protein SARC_05165 [Sphaeroforma arctica JP610]|eukprot:XP_014156454.1 hypothetical protein SARC_05165 [Sphaeroforma arctica JP610]
MSPFVSMGFVTAGFYASCTSYGAFAICQMYGLVPGHRLIQRMPSFVFFTAVPMIPFLLVIPRLYSPALLASILSVSTNTVTGRVMPDGQVVYNDDDVLWEDVPGDAEDTSTRASRTNSFSTDTHEGLEASNVRDTDDRRSRAGSQDAYEVVFDLDIGGSTPGARTPRTSLNRGIEHADYMNPGDSIDAGEYPQINNGRQDYVQDSMIQIDVDLGQGTFRDGTPFTRILAGGLMLPVVSAYVGNLLFYGRLQSTRIQRSLLGGFIYLTVRQCVKKLYAITLEKRLERRLVLDMPRPSDYLNEST